MNKFIFSIGLLVCVFIAMTSCSARKAEPVKQRYGKAMPIRVNETRHPQYNSRVVGEVFVSVFLTATNQKRYSGEPPFKLSIGFYSIKPEASHVKVLSAEMFVNNGVGINITGHLSALETDTNVSLSRADCGDCGHYGGEYLITDYFISAAPVDDDHVKIIIKIEIDSDHVGELIFDFIPEVLSGTPRGFPA